MKSVRLTLEHGPETVHPMHRFVAEHDALDRYRLVHWNFAPDRHNVFLFHVNGDREAYRKQLIDTEEIISFDITGDGAPFYVYVCERPNELGKQLIDAFTQDSLVAVPPLEYRMDWTVHFGIVGEPPDIQAALDALPDGIEPTIEQVGEYNGLDSASAQMTSRQRATVRVARELGYFAVPREATLEEVATRIGCAPGTAAEHLRKAESTVMEHLDV